MHRSLLKPAALFCALLMCLMSLVPAAAAVRGDVDGNGVLDTEDARMALRQSLDLENYEAGSARYIASDANGDGLVDTEDARLLLRECLGLENEERPEVPAAGKVSKAFARRQMDFALSMLRVLMKDENKNIMISPLSAAYALAMTANGTAGDTLQGLLSAMGETDLTEFLEQLYAVSASLPETERCYLRTANSIWISRYAQPHVQKSFLRESVRWFNAGVNLIPEDGSGAELINKWVAGQTNDMIKKIVNYVSPETLMILLNALCMEAEWMIPFDEASVTKAPFTKADGKKTTAQMMRGEEMTYLENDDFTGFIKPYFGGELQFAALLPKEELKPAEFTELLSGKSLSQLLYGAQRAKVLLELPKFSFSFGSSLKPVLASLGADAMFDPGRADFSAMFRDLSDVYVDDVIQKTFVDVNTKGTRAAAVTAVIVKENAFVMEYHTVTLDRPFLFVITAGKAHVPVFIGVVCDPSAT